MSHTIHLSDGAYRALLEAAHLQGQTLEAYIEDLASRLAHDPAQKWLSTPDWQEGERRATEELATAQSEYFDDEAAFLAALEFDINTS